MILSSHIDAAQLQGKLFAKTIKTKLSKNEEYIIEYNSNREAPKFKIPENYSSRNLVLRYISEALALKVSPH